VVVTRVRGVVAAAGVAVTLLAGCAAARPDVRALDVPSTPLVGEEGRPIDARGLAAGAPFTVFVFFSPDCHCLSAHEPRLLALADATRERGVRFVAIDSETRGSPARDAEEARRRGYPFPILVDRGAKLADAVGAVYAGYAVVVDAGGRIRYRGGIDSDKTHLHDDAQPYLKDALDDLFAGREPRVAEGKTLGCALQRW
jgi:hypothetical protein